MVQPIISCVTKIQIGLTVLVQAYPGCPGKDAIKWVSLRCSYQVGYTCIKHYNLTHVICQSYSVRNSDRKSKPILLFLVQYLILKWSVNKFVHICFFVSDIAIFVLKRDVKLQLTN